MIVLSALLIGLAVGLAVPPSAEPRLARWSTESPSHPRRRSRGWWPWAAALSAGLGCWVLLGGAVGAVAGIGCVIVLPRLLSRLESRSDRRRRAELARQVPPFAELLSATLASGAPLGRSLAVVSEAVGEPTRTALAPVLAAMDLGADPVEAWRSTPTEPAHEELAAAIIRSLESGAPLSRIMGQLGEDARRRHRAAVEVAARSAGVRAVAPLAACFLPAFLLLGVVPVVASLAGALLS